MEDTHDKDGNPTGLPPVHGDQSFPHTTFYNNLLAAQTDQQNPSLQETFPSWSPYGAGAVNGMSLGGLDMGYDSWADFTASPDFQNYAADTFATSGHLPTAANFGQSLDHISGIGQPASMYTGENLPQNQQFSGGLDVNLDFLQAYKDGRDLYEAASQQLADSPTTVPSSPFTGRAYDPFGTTEVFPAVESVVQAQAQEQSSVDFTPSQPAKPSYSDVAKHKLSVGEAINSKKETSHVKEQVISSEQPQAVTTSVKSKKSKTFAARSRSVPVEPTTIHPDSRYGLDTFDDPLKSNPQHSRLSHSGCSSRKGSCSSEDVFLERPQDCINVYDIQGPGPGVGLKYHAELGELSKDADSKMETKSSKGHDKKSKNVPKNKVFFDPKRIFSEGEKKTSTSEKSFIPNNQQNFHHDESDVVMNNGKTKSNWKTSSTKYINNDLRDSKKQTNTEARNTAGLYSEKSIYDEEEDDPMPPPGSVSHNKGKRSDHNNGTSSAKKSTSTMTDEPAVKTPGKRTKKEKTDVQHIIRVWLLHLWGWIVWGVQEIITLGMRLIKLLCSVTMLFALVVCHYMVSTWRRGWNYVSSKIPFLHRYASTHDPLGGGTAGGTQAKARAAVGLKENITLPSTGNEAMKRLLSCKGKDPYSILGLRADATDEDIKRYYRRQAVLVHPDKNQQPGAEEAFKILGHAIELIGEADKRRQYDSQRTEAQEAESAMQEFADLLTKLHDKMEEAANMMRCDHCGGKHKRVLVQWPAYGARFCSRCNLRHPAKEGDVWAESSVLGFLWHYYACMEGKVYDITEWASCQHESFKCLQANAHQVIYRISTGAGRHRANSSRASEADLEDFLSNLFHQSGSAPGGAPAGDARFPSSSAAPPASASTASASAQKSQWSGTGAGGPGGKKGGRNRRKRKH